VTESDPIWVLFQVPCPTPDGRSAQNLYQKRVDGISPEVRASATRHGCTFHRAWYAADGSFVSSAEMAPCDDSDQCPTYYPEGDYRFALETFQGDLATLGAGPGSKLTVGGDCP